MGEIEKYKKGIALVVGINDYNHLQKLGNAVYDAKSIAQSLEKLTFHTMYYYDICIKEFDDALNNFIDQLNNFDVGVFYFAGHGIEIKGKNYLLAKDSSCDTEAGATRFSMNLQDVIDRMNETPCNTKILIIDACRNNPFSNNRGIGTTNLAPIFAPKGTIIAYSTSPGETAMDGGIGMNSIYTGALIKHIDELGLPIESFFKKVRTSVYNLSNGKQTSWEHTSLIGKFSFNSGQLVHSLNIPYSMDVVIDNDYNTQSDLKIAHIINGFKSYNYYKQNDALKDFENIDILSLNKNQLFIIGRNILQSAIGGAYDSIEFIKDPHRIAKYTNNGENHLLNGIFFEMYFNKESHLRENIKSKEFLFILLDYHTDTSLQCSFEFINKVLIPFEQNFLQIPSVQMNIVSLDVKLNKEKYKDPYTDEESECYIIQSIKKDTKELLIKSSDYDNDFDIFSDFNYISNMPRKFTSLDNLNDWLSNTLGFPKKFIKIISNDPNPRLPIVINNYISLKYATN